MNPACEPITPPTILVVDDDQAVRNSLKFSLEAEGFSVRIYPNGVALLNDSKLPSRGCVVIDYKLPGMNGLDLAEELLHRDVKLPVILITTHPTPAVRARAAGAHVPLIEKPLLSEALFQSIREALDEASQRRFN